MPIKHAIWKVGSQPQLLQQTALPEQALERMIMADIKILSDDWMVIGNQVSTDFGGRLDILAIAPDGSLIVIELKGDKTPRDVVAQAIDYATWVEKLQPDEVAGIYGHHRNFSEDFYKRFGHRLDEDSLNQNHQIVVVASSLDESTERIVGYLSERDIPINVLCFQVFNTGDEQLLSRAWLLDPVRAQAANAIKADKGHEPWNGEFYCSFGADESRAWEDAVEYGFISAGGGSWYSRTLELLGPEDRVWVNIPGKGFVGVGKVIGASQPASSFEVENKDGRARFIDIATRAHYHRSYLTDPEKCEYFVPVQWLDVVPLENAFQEVGLFGNQNTVCRPTSQKWRSTVERLKQEFPKWKEV